MKTDSTIGLTQKLLFYSLGAGAVTMAAASAHGEIVFTDLSADPATADTIDYALTSPTVLSDSTNADFELTTKTGLEGDKQALNESISADAETVSDGVNQSKLAYSTSIGPTSIFTSEESYMNSNGSGEWNVGDRGYLGLEISLNGTTVYGWADVSLNSDPGGPPTSGVVTNAPAAGIFTLYGYAYQDDGTPIGAGVVPEPGTAALLVAGAAGVAVLRRRRASRE